MQKSQKVILTYLVITGLYTLSASLIWGINTLFLMKAGLTIFQVFLINAVFTASMAVFEIPTGIFADTLGRKASFLFCLIILLLSTIGYVFAAARPNNFFYFILMSVCLGIGFTFYSGAVEAWLVDALKATRFQGQLDHVFARGNTIFSFSMLAGTIGGGFLGNLNLAFPYYCRALLLLLVFLISLVFMQDYGFIKKPLTLRKIPLEIKKIAKNSLQYGLLNRSVRYLMILTFILFLFFMWAWYAWQPYFLQLLGDPNAVWVAGIISALLSLTQALGSSLVNRVMRLFSKRSRLFLISYSLQIAALIGVGLAGNFYLAVACFVLFLLFLSLTSPVKQAYLHDLIPGEQRATIISFDSLVGSAGSAAGQIGLGYLSKVFSIGMGYFISGCVLVLSLPVTLLLSRQNDRIDQITLPQTNQDKINNKL